MKERKGTEGRLRSCFPATMLITLTAIRGADVCFLNLFMLNTKREICLLQWTLIVFIGARQEDG